MNPQSTSSPKPAWITRLRDRLFPRGANLIQWAAYVILISIMVLYAVDHPQSTVREFTITMSILGILLLLNLLWEDILSQFHSKQVGTWFLLILSSGLMLASLFTGELINVIYICFMLAAQANLMLRIRPAILFSLAISLAFLGVVAILIGPSDQIAGIAVSVAIGLTFVVTLSQVLRLYEQQTERTRLLLEDLKQVNAELLAARQKERDLAVAEERVRLARDIHDGLGHHLTVLSLQLQAAEKNLTSNPVLAATAIGTSRQEVQAALREVRQSVAALRQTPVDTQNLPDAIRNLASDFENSTGILVTMNLSGQPVILNPAVAMTLFRAAQEGLTNTQKHAQDVSRVVLSLVFKSQEVFLEIQDDGKTSDKITSTSGFGLAGLQERANLLGGEFTTGTNLEGGFLLKITLPLEKEA
jgi:signal transduction histidine kinase